MSHKLTDTEVEFLIARANGWQIITDSKGTHFIPPGWRITTFISFGEPFYELPDYLNDERVMREAEKRLTPEQLNQYIGEFAAVLIASEDQSTLGQQLWHASARQRAYAYARVLLRKPFLS